MTAEGSNRLGLRGPVLLALLLPLCLALGCQNHRQVTTEASSAHREQPGSPAKETVRPVVREDLAEVFTWYEVEEGWSISLSIGRDGCFRRLESIGDPGGGRDQDSVCTGCIPEPEALWRTIDGMAEELVPETESYGQSIPAPRGGGGQTGHYALIVTLAGARRAPRDEVDATALVPALRTVLEAAEAVLDSDGRAHCAALDGSVP